MSKQKKLLFLALSAAVLCPAQQNRSATTSLGTYTELAAGNTAIYNGSAFSPSLTYGLYIRNNQLWRLNIATGQTTSVVNPATQPYTYTASNQIADSGITLIYGGGPSGTGIYRINLDGTINPVLVQGQVLSQGTVTFPSNPVLTRDGSKATIEGIMNNTIPTLFLYDLSNGSINILQQAKSLTDPFFFVGLYSSEANILWGYSNQANGEGAYTIATMTLNGTTTNVGNPLSSTYALAEDDQAASSRHGMLVAAPRITTTDVGTMTAVDLLSYSSDANNLSVLVNSDNLAPLAINEQSVISSNSNAESAFDASNLYAEINNGVAFASGVYRISPVDSPTPQMIAGTGMPLFDGEKNTIDSAPAIGENGSIIFTHCWNVVYGQEPNQCSLGLFTPSAPYIFPGGVVRASDSANQVTPLGWFAVYGHGFNCNDLPAQFGTTGCVGQTSSLPVQVFANGIACPLWYVSPGQINAQMPKEVAAGTVNIQVVVGTLQSNQQTIQVVSIDPSFYQYNGQAIVTHAASGALVTASNPLSVGEYFCLWADGLGSTVNDPADGQGYATNPLPRTVNAVSVTIGGTSVTPTYAGGAPTLTGIYQVVAQVPTPGGTLPGDTNAGSVITVPGTIEVAGQTVGLSLSVAVSTVPPPPAQ